MLRVHAPSGGKNKRGTNTIRRWRQMKPGYYVITERHEYWCASMATAKYTQREFGGEIISADERLKRLLKDKNKENKNDNRMQKQG